MAIVHHRPHDPTQARRSSTIVVKEFLPRSMKVGSSNPLITESSFLIVQFHGIGLVLVLVLKQSLIRGNTRPETWQIVQYLQYLHDNVIFMIM